MWNYNVVIFSIISIQYGKPKSKNFTISLIYCYSTFFPGLNGFLANITLNGQNGEGPHSFTNRKKRK